MTEKGKKVSKAPKYKTVQYCDVPERSVGHFSSSEDVGIVVDVEIQAGDPVDSQFIRNFMGEFEAASNKRSA